MLTGTGNLDFGEVAHHPPQESELQKLKESLVVVMDEREALIAVGEERFSATVTTNPRLVLIVRQFTWMELFAQRNDVRIGSKLRESLDPSDRQLLEVYSMAKGAPLP